MPNHTIDYHRMSRHMLNHTYWCCKDEIERRDRSGIIDCADCNHPFYPNRDGSTDKLCFCCAHDEKKRGRDLKDITLRHTTSSPIPDIVWHKTPPENPQVADAFPLIGYHEDGKGNIVKDGTHILTKEEVQEAVDNFMREKYPHYKPFTLSLTIKDTPSEPPQETPSAGITPSIQAIWQRVLDNQEWQLRIHKVVESHGKVIPDMLQDINDLENLTPSEIAVVRKIVRNLKEE